MKQVNARYVGKPLVRLLECYVLWAIGKLSDEQASSLEQMTPKLQSLYNHSGDWPAIVASTVHMTTETPEALKSMWENNLAMARRNAVLLAPQQFAEMVVDENFALSA